MARDSGVTGRDRVVQRGNRLIVCAGALAERYAALGGDVVMVGKPYAPIYEAAVGEAMRLKPDLAREQIVAIGDGMVTDAEGAHAQGLALAFIRGGIHGADFANDAAAWLTLGTFTPADFNLFNASCVFLISAA